MKHILIYILIALCIFGFMGFYFAQDKNNIVASADSARAEIAKQEILQVGVLINNMEAQSNASFASTVTTQLSNIATVTVSDCIGDSSVQMNYLNRMLKQGIKYLLVQPVNAEGINEMISQASAYKATLIVLGSDLTQEQMNAYDRVFAVKGPNDEDADLKAVASALSSYWKNNRDSMDLDSDGTLKYAVISDYGFEDSGKAAKLASLLAQADCTAKMEDDVITRYLNYNYESQLDMIFFHNVDVILFTDSADAEKAYNYFHDPSEYRNVPKQKLCLMDADETAYSLYESGKVLFAAGTGGTVTGRAAAALITSLEKGETPKPALIGAVSGGNDRTYQVNSAILRQNLPVSQANAQAADEDTQ